MKSKSILIIVAIFLSLFILFIIYYNTPTHPKKNDQSPLRMLQSQENLIEAPFISISDYSTKPTTWKNDAKNTTFSYTCKKDPDAIRNYVPTFLTQIQDDNMKVVNSRVTYEGSQGHPTVCVINPLEQSAGVKDEDQKACHDLYLKLTGNQVSGGTVQINNGNFGNRGGNFGTYINYQCVDPIGWCLKYNHPSIYKLKDWEINYCKNAMNPDNKSQNLQGSTESAAKVSINKYCKESPDANTSAYCQKEYTTTTKDKCDLANNDFVLLENCTGKCPSDQYLNQHGHKNEPSGR